MITISTLGLVIAVFAIFGTVFSVYLYFKNPQIKTDQDTIKIKDEIEGLKKQILEIKETHLRSVENDLKSLTSSVNELSKTVIKLSTIIDERIPRATSNLNSQV